MALAASVEAGAFAATSARRGPTIVRTRAHATRLRILMAAAVRASSGAIVPAIKVLGRPPSVREEPSAMRATTVRLGQPAGTSILVAGPQSPSVADRAIRPNLLTPAGPHRLLIRLEGLP